MKKILLSIFVTLGGLMTTNAQSITSQDFNALSIGNVGTDLTGATPGQGGFLTVATGTGAANSNFQIVADNIEHANVLQITGQPVASGNRYTVNNDIQSLWPTRTAGNDIIEIEFDFNPGPATASKNSFGVRLYDATGTKIIAALLIAMDTKIVSGAVYANPGTPGNYGYGLGATAVLTADTWVRMGMSFNKTTGEIKWKGPGFDTFYTGASAGIDPYGAYFFIGAGTSNVVAAVGKFDNFSIKATNTDTLLDVTNFTTENSSKIAVYPNPANDFVNISTHGTSQINKVSIVDVNGRMIKSLNLNDVAESQINISDLNAGIYFMNINTNEGSITKKIIKN